MKNKSIMKTITINVEFELSDDMPAEVPMTTDEFANRIKSCFKQETSEKEVIGIKVSVTDFSGLSFME